MEFTIVVEAKATISAEITVEADDAEAAIVEALRIAKEEQGTFDWDVDDVEESDIDDDSAKVKP